MKLKFLTKPFSIVVFVFLTNIKFLSGHQFHKIIHIVKTTIRYQLDFDLLMKLIRKIKVNPHCIII